MLCPIIVEHLEIFLWIRWDLNEVVVAATGASPNKRDTLIHDYGKSGPASDIEKSINVYVDKIELWRGFLINVKL